VKDHGDTNDLADRIAGDTAFGLSRADVETVLDPVRHTGRAEQQVEAFLRDHVTPVLARYNISDDVPELRA
jgi:adenylosuccinate lyase